MQTQFWKRFQQEELSFVYAGKTTANIATLINIFVIILNNYFLLAWVKSSSLIIAIFIVFINGLILRFIYQYNQTIKSGIQARKIMIEATFETIHNGSLQTLAKVLKMVKTQEDTPMNELLPLLEKELEELNQELRGMYDFWQQETLTQNTSLYLGNNLVIDLRNPLHEILYQVYSYTLERDFPCFRTLKLKIYNFEPIHESSLSLENKRGLCRFLEEALCNVGKHATEITCLQVTYSLSEGHHTLSIIDNGWGIHSSKEGWGTKQFKNFAQQIKGNFRRVSLDPQGTLCELSWPL